jgi:signal transduction histidine kinase
MDISEPNTIILAIEVVLHLLIAGIIIKRHSLKERPILWLFLYVLLATLWAVTQVLAQFDRLAFLPARVLKLVPLYGTFLLAFFFLHLSRSFLRLQRSGWRWWTLGGVWAVALVFLDVNPLAFPDVLLERIKVEHVIFGMLLIGWGFFVGGATLLTVKTYRQTVQPLHRNRITYWPLALALIFVGGVFSFTGDGAPGCALFLLSVPIAAYVVLTEHLPDVRQTVRQVLSYLLATILTIALYAGGTWGTWLLFKSTSNYTALIVGASIALILAILFRPLLGLIQRIINWLIPQRGYDPSHIVREYSTRISNVLHLQRLAEVILNVIGKAMETQNGLLFLIRPKEEQDEKNKSSRLRLESVQTTGAGKRTSTVLAADSPIVRYLREERRPLTQYEIDLRPQFQEAFPEECAWLSDLGMDVYVPIYTKEELSGLLALGPKASGDRYFEQDLILLSTLADQTAVALENARLVEDLVRLNKELKHAYITLEQMYNELEEAYADLEQANLDLARVNRQLQEMDNLKSAFIGIVTHELRSPFANLTFSMQLLERYGVERWSIEQREQLEQLKQGLKAAKRMVDNLVTFATFLSKQGELRLDQLDLCAVIRDTLEPLRSLTESKGIALHIETPETLPQLCGDQERLSDAVHHLVDNAIKFTGTGGTVNVRCWIEAHEVCFEVRDTGVGIPKDKLPTLWDAFTQMADPLRRGVEGLGLGLALVKYIALAHDGQVWAESTEGAGSTFGFRFPLDGHRAEPSSPLATKREPEKDIVSQAGGETDLLSSSFAMPLDDPDSSAIVEEMGSPGESLATEETDLPENSFIAFLEGDDRLAAFLAEPDEHGSSEIEKEPKHSPQQSAEQVRQDLPRDRFTDFLAMTDGEKEPDPSIEVQETKGWVGDRLSTLFQLTEREETDSPQGEENDNR